MSKASRWPALAVAVSVIIVSGVTCGKPEEGAADRSLETPAPFEDPQARPTTGGWLVSEAPMLEIGAVDGPPAETFTNPWPVRLSDGRVVVLSGRELRYFNMAGDHMFSVGGRGQGPGEFEFPDRPIVLHADSLAVFDLMMRRLTLFDGEGVVVSTAAIPSPEEPLQPQVFHRLDDGSLLVLAVLVPTGEGRETGSVWRMSPGGEPLAQISGSWEGATMSADGWIPFSASNPNPVWNGSVVLGNRDNYTFQTYDLNGMLERTFTKQTTLQPVTAEDLAEHQAWSLNGASPQRRAEILRTFASPHVPQTHAAFGPMLADRVGNLWVGEYDPRPDGRLKLPGRPLPWDVARVWSVFSSDGVWITDVDMPDGLQVTDIGDDYVLGVAMGEFDVPYVRMHALVK